MSTYLTAAAAAKRLGVTRATLYAYVSRGLIRSRSVSGRRERQYLGQDVERLVQRASGRRDPAGVATQALGVMGLPVLSSGLTLIEAGRLYYRGQDALRLSRSERFEDVAGLLWGGPWQLDAPPYVPSAAQRARYGRLHFARAGQCYLADAEAQDPGAFHQSVEAVRRSGARILVGLGLLAAGASEAPQGIALALARAWGLSGPRAHLPLEAALILCADHELNVSAFTARVRSS